MTPAKEGEYPSRWESGQFVEGDAQEFARFIGREGYDACARFIRWQAERLRAALADAERYRWLRTIANMDYPVRHGAPGVSINMPTGNNAAHYPVQSDLDAAIDAARAGKE